MFWIGVDVGGTFTDLICYDDATGALVATKTPSTRDNHALGILNGIAKLSLDLAATRRITHGMTLATNVILEHKGARVGMVTTKGYRDVLELGRGNRHVLYDIRLRKPKPLVPRSRVYEATERTLFDGTIRQPVNRDELRAIAEALTGQGVEAVAIGLLHSYMNDRNEREAYDLLRTALPGVFLSTSASVLPEFREYERFSTTVLNAYVGPLIDRYLKTLQELLHARGYREDLYIVTSSGGVMNAEWTRQFPVSSVLSGPAGGVAGAVYLGHSADYPNLITYDMGGTSTDVCLIKDLKPAMTAERKIAEYPNRALQIDINTIGAGGGSIAWIDVGHVLNVGPQSAGAMPGPACYGMGGAEATVTDANLLLNRMNPAAALGGEIYLKPELAVEALRRVAAHYPGMDEFNAAEGIIKIAVTKMTGAIKEISMVKGYDPRDFALCAFGGAGPMHVCQIALELGMRRIIIPPTPGNFSAFGLLVSDVRRDQVRTRIMPTARISWETLETIFLELEEAGEVQMQREGIPLRQVHHERSLGMRYIGQSFDLTVPMQPGYRTIADLEEAFHRLHQERYSHAARKACEIVNVRLSTFGIVPKPALRELSSPSTTLAEALIERRPVSFDGEFGDTPIYRREKLPVGLPFDGPAILEEAGATTVITPGYGGYVDRFGNVVIECR